MIVGFAGYARTGKHEAASCLDMYGFKTVAFADKLREMLYVLNPIVDSELTSDEPIRLQKIIDSCGWDGYKKTRWNDEIRRLIQTLGTDCGRNLLGDSVWIDAALTSSTQNLAVADVRFPNEAQAIVDRGGIIVRINNSDTGPANAHESEVALDDWPFDAIIQNDGTIPQLHNKVRQMVKWHMDKNWLSSI